MVEDQLPEAAQGSGRRPSTPASDHSSDWSGGEANMMNRRAVSAPYWSIKALRIDAVVLRLGHFLSPADHHRQAVGLQRGARSGGPRSSVTTSTSAGLIHCFLPPSRIAVEGRGNDHALGQQVGEGLAQIADQADIAHQLGEEARVEQVEDGVFDAADVLVDAALAPVGDALVDHGRGVVRAGIAQESTRTTRRRCPWCRFRAWHRHRTSDTCSRRTRASGRAASRRR